MKLHKVTSFHHAELSFHFTLDFLITGNRESWGRIFTSLQSLVIHVGHRLMLQAFIVTGLFSSIHPELNWPFCSMQLTLRCLIPFPQETEH